MVHAGKSVVSSPKCIPNKISVIITVVYTLIIAWYIKSSGNKYNLRWKHRQSMTLLRMVNLQHIIAHVGLNLFVLFHAGKSVFSSSKCIPNKIQVNISVAYPLIITWDIKSSGDKYNLRWKHRQSMKKMRHRVRTIMQWGTCIAVTINTEVDTAIIGTGITIDEIFKKYTFISQKI